MQCYGPEASDYTRARLLGQPVTLERDAETRDIYGRLLMYVSLDGERFNDELLRLGYAALARHPAERSARARHARRGARRATRRDAALWGAC